MFKKINLLLLFFAAILILGSVLRLYRLGEVPFGFHIDEASIGYNAYSLLLTGKDDNGQSMPLYIDIFGDQRPAGYHYTAIPSVKLFGLTEFATRLPSALFGIFSILAIFFLTHSIFHNKYVALISSFLLAISPWHVVLSRATSETIIALFFIILGFYLVLRSFREGKTNLLFLGGTSLVLSFFFYHTPRVFVPLLLLVLGIFSYGLLKKTKFLKRYIVLTGLVGAVSIFLVFSVSGGMGRYSQVNIFGHPETRLVLEEEIREDGVSGITPFWTRVSHNKVSAYSRTFVNNYFEYFSGKFLFMEGGLPVWYKVPHMGLIHLVELPFILLGLFYLFRSKDMITKFIPLWIIVAPITAALTLDDVPNIQRAIVLFPALEIAAAYGIYAFVQNYKAYRKLLMSILFVALALGMYYFLHQYFVHSRVHMPWYRNNGFEEMMDKVAKSYDSFDSIIVTNSIGGSYPLILFYSKYEPKTYQEEGSTKDHAFTSFGKFFFTPTDCPSINPDSRFPNVEKIIFIDNGSCPSSEALEDTRVEYVLREDGTRAFRIVYDEAN